MKAKGQSQNPAKEPKPSPNPTAKTAMPFKSDEKPRNNVNERGVRRDD